MQAPLFAVGGRGPAIPRGSKANWKGWTRRRPEKRIETKEVEELKERVSCEAVLEKAGFAIDVKESTRRAVSRCALT